MNSTTMNATFQKIVQSIKKIHNIEETYKNITACVFFKFCNPPYYTLFCLMSEKIQYEKRFTKGLTSESIWGNLKPATILTFPIVHENRQVEDYLNPVIFYTHIEQHKYEYCSYTITPHDTINAEYKITGSNNVYNNIGSVFSKTTKTVESDFEGLGFEFARGYVFQSQNVYPIFSTLENNKTYVWVSPQSQYNTNRTNYHQVNYLDNDFTQSLDKDTNMRIELNRGNDGYYHSIDCVYLDKDEKWRIHSAQLTQNEKRFIVPYYDSDDYDDDGNYSDSD
jgi:hypothetical protein